MLWRDFDIICQSIGSGPPIRQPGSSSEDAEAAVLIALVGAHLINDLYTTVLPAFLPAVAEEFDLNYTELGILSFAFVVLTGALQPMLGSTADRLGRRRWILVFGFIAGAVGFVAMAVAPNFWFIVAVSLLVGLGGATYHPQATAFIVSAYPDRRGKMLGIHGWGGSAGNFLAPAVVVVMVAAFNWRIAMVALAVPLLIAAGVLRATLTETTPAPNATLKGAFSKPLVVVALSFGAMSMVGRSFLTFFVKMLVDEGWDETDAGFALALILLGGAIAQPLGGAAFDRIGGRRVFLVATISTAALVALFSVTDGAISLAAIAGIAFFLVSLFPVALALASRLAPPSQTGAAAGVVFGVSSLVTAAAQPVVGVLAESLGDVRAALAWQLPVALLSIVLASRISTPSRAERI